MERNWERGILWNGTGNEASYGTELGTRHLMERNCGTRHPMERNWEQGILWNGTGNKASYGTELGTRHLMEWD